MKNLQKLFGVNPVAAGMIRNVVIICLALISLGPPNSAFGGDSLHKAAHSGNIDLVRKILKTDVDPDERDSFGGTALHAAMFQKSTEIITLLINHGFDVNAQGLSNGYTPLHDAVWANNLPAAKLMVAAGAKLDIKNHEGQTPMEKAKSEGKKELVDFLEAAVKKGRK